MYKNENLIDAAPNPLYDKPMNKTWKRGNWTNEEVISFILGYRLVNPQGIEDEEWYRSHNSAIEDVASLFEDFMRPQDQFGAMAYCIEDKGIYHIGKIPDGMIN